MTRPCNSAPPALFARSIASFGVFAPDTASATMFTMMKSAIVAADA